MRKMVLSFKPEIYERIKAGKKVFEYRRTFPDEEIQAYMYISAPVKCITGILELGQRIELMEWYDKYESTIIRDRILRYMKKNNYVMPIISFQDTTSIYLDELRTLEGFTVPQMYFYLDNYPKVAEYIESNLIKTEYRIDNSFEQIDDNMICR